MLSRLQCQILDHFDHKDNYVEDLLISIGMGTQSLLKKDFGNLLHDCSRLALCLLLFIE